ncbi:unnamed protein product [Cunninghamella echinulata]
MSGTSSLSENYLNEERTIDIKHRSLLDTLLPFEIADDFSSLLDKIQQIQVTDDDILPSLPVHNNFNQENKEKDVSYEINNNEDNNNSMINHGIKEENSIKSPEIPVSTPLITKNHPYTLNTPNLSIFSPTSTTYSNNTSPILSPTFSTRTTTSKRSMKSSKSIASKRLKKKSNCIYHPRSYEEMARIPDIHERIRFYEKTYQLCIQAESPLTAWLKKYEPIDSPEPMIKDINSPKPSIAIKSPSMYPSLKNKLNNNPLRLSRSSSNSFRSFFRKSSSTITNNSQSPDITSSPDIISSPESIKRTPKLSKSMNFRNSFSSLQKSSSTKITPLLSRNRIYDKSLTLSTIPKKRSLFQLSHLKKNDSPSLSNTTYISSPLELNNYHYQDFNNNINNNYTNNNSMSQHHHLHHYNLHQHNNSSNSNNYNTNEAALLEMQHILPQLDTSVLQQYLIKANGDTMVAITMAIQNMKSVTSVQ